jgi:hypothetical protein
MNANLRTIGGALGGHVTASIVISGRVLGYPGPGRYMVSLVIMVAVSVAAAVVAATVPLTTGKAGSSCSPP